MKRQAAERRGRRGEGWAGWWLRLHGWRIVALGLAIALPFCVWLGTRPGMQAFYAHMLGRIGWKSLLANALVIVVEHAWIQGVILSLALPRDVSTSVRSSLACV